MKPGWSSPVFFVLVILAIAGLWSTWPSHPLEMVHVDWQGTIHRGDQAASDVVLREYGSGGRLELLATAGAAYHEPAGNRTVLEQVHLQRFRTGGGSLEIQGRHALLLDGDRQVILKGDVVAVLQPDSILRTRKLEYVPATGIIQTRDPVHLSRGSSHLQGVGLWASVKTRQVRIEKHVQGLYVQ